MNRRERRAATRICCLCRRSRGLRSTDYCGACIEEQRERLRCPDCNSVITITVAEGVQGIWADKRHDSTCPTWIAKRAAAS